jgi:hypothetical protein
MKVATSSRLASKEADRYEEFPASDSDVKQVA